MEPVKTIRSRTAVLPNSNIDTDQIIPARFLTTTTREGLGKHLFNEWRYDATGALRPDFALNKPEAQGCQVLVGGRNLGCGSSREHVISTEIADIFRNNSLKNGLVPIVVDEDTSRWLMEHPGAEVEIDIATATLALPTGATVTFPIEGFARYCLLNGVDELGFLLERMPQIQAYERSHPI
jgi:3-isopropylmalate/(R)-2-methylmalate dehydratase small subunit